MKFNVYKMIKTEYDKRRRDALDELENKKSELYRRIPRLEEIEDEINKAGFKYNKAILTGSLLPDEAAEQLSETIEKLNAERTLLLSDNGYPSDYLTPSFQCEKCSDTGIIQSQKGSSICICYRQQLINYLYDQSNLSTIDAKGFESFRTDFYPDVINEEKYGIKKSPRKQMLGILGVCKDFVKNFEENETKNLLFSGPTGVGKTFLGSCIAMELMNLGYTVLYQTAPTLFNTIYEYRFNSANNEGWEDTIYTNILESDLLIIDDLGTESPTAMRYAELLNILDTRMANDTRKPCKTIIATNIDLKKLFEYYDERIVSRLIGGFEIFKFAGDDIRRLKRS